MNLVSESWSTFLIYTHPNSLNCIFLMPYDFWSCQRLLNSSVKDTICLGLVAHPIKLNSQTVEQMNLFHLFWHETKCAKKPNSDVGLACVSREEPKKGENNPQVQSRNVTHV